MNKMYSFFKKLIFTFSPEKAHYLTVDLFKFGLRVPFFAERLKKSFLVENPSLKRQLFGLEFPNPVGLAAGFDKDGKFYDTMSNLGFGFVEIGTVTPLAQTGNPKPRLFRVPQDEAIINRMGFNNDGVDALVERLKKKEKSRYILGGNIGKNKATPNENAVEDYIICFEKLFPYVDYFVVNVSSPNTPNLRALQDKGPLTEILSSLQILNNLKDKRKPILLKIAPDLTDGQLDDIVEIVDETEIDGVIATNTTIDRSSLSISENEIQTIGNGGLSGKPLRGRSTEVIKYLHNKSNGKLPIIGVGGIDSPAAAIEKLQAGASLVQVYSGLIYYGPNLVKDINNHLLQNP